MVEQVRVVNYETAEFVIPTNSTITVNPLTPANITCVERSMEM
jgi:hypothetical protein